MERYSSGRSASTRLLTESTFRTSTQKAGLLLMYWIVGDKKGGLPLFRSIRAIMSSDMVLRTKTSIVAEPPDLREQGLAEGPLLTNLRGKEPAFWGGTLEEALDVEAGDPVAVAAVVLVEGAIVKRQCRRGV